MIGRMVQDSARGKVLASAVSAALQRPENDAFRQEVDWKGKLKNFVQKSVCLVYEGSGKDAVIKLRDRSKALLASVGETPKLA